MKRAITALSVLIIAFALFSNFETRAAEAKKKETKVSKLFKKKELTYKDDKLISSSTYK